MSKNFNKLLNFVPAAKSASGTGLPTRCFDCSGKALYGTSMSDWEQPKNYGWEDVEYSFGLNDEATIRVSRILNEACHVFYYHRDGNWESSYKEQYASELAVEFKQYSNLSSRLLKSNDRVVKMVAFRALELLKDK